MATTKRKQTDYGTGVCKQCGAEFKKKRSWQEYCNTTCRVAGFYGRRVGGGTGGDEQSHAFNAKGSGMRSTDGGSCVLRKEEGHAFNAKVPAVDSGGGPGVAPEKGNEVATGKGAGNGSVESPDPKAASTLNNLAGAYASVLGVSDLRPGA